MAHRVNHRRGEDRKLIHSRRDCNSRRGPRDYEWDNRVSIEEAEKILNACKTGLLVDLDGIIHEI